MHCAIYTPTILSVKQKNAVDLMPLHYNTKENKDQRGTLMQIKKMSLTSLITLPVLMVAIGIAQCKKGFPANEAVKSDLQNYLKSEMPKMKATFNKLNEIEKEYKETTGEPAGPKVDSKELIRDRDYLKEAVAKLKQVQVKTPELLEIHSVLISGIEKMQQSFATMVTLENDKSEELSSLRQLWSAMKGIFGSIKTIRQYQDQLERACKANGLEADFQKFVSEQEK